MISYKPPKSQVWGHQVGRLSASDVVDRALRFLEQECTIASDPSPSELMLGWMPATCPAASELAIEINQTLGPPREMRDHPSSGGKIFRQHRWSFTADKLPTIAGWIDRLAEPLAAGDAVVHCSTNWIFTWRGEPPPVVPLESPGGMFGVHLGKPHRVTTMFSFGDMEKYERIKASLAEHRSGRAIRSSSAAKNGRRKTQERAEVLAHANRDLGFDDHFFALKWRGRGWRSLALTVSPRPHSSANIAVGLQRRVRYTNRASKPSERISQLRRVSSRLATPAPRPPAPSSSPLARPRFPRS